MGAMDGTFQVGPVHLAWEPRERLARMYFDGPGADPGSEEAAACIATIEQWAGSEPFRLLVDCAGLRSTQAGWRSEFASFFKRRGHTDRVAWFNMNPLVDMMVTMFVRGVGIRGRGFRDEAAARAWLGRDGDARP